MKKDFTRKVLEVVGKIPSGKLMTYKQVAKKAGSQKAYRAVGSILRRNFRQEKNRLPFYDFSAQGRPASGWQPVPCHRVIRSDGHVGSYAKGQPEKEKILTSEGHIIDRHKIKLPDLI